MFYIEQVAALSNAGSWLINKRLRREIGNGIVHGVISLLDEADYTVAQALAAKEVCNLPRFVVVPQMSKNMLKKVTVSGGHLINVGPNVADKVIR